MSHHPPVSCIPNTGKMLKAKKVIEEAKEINNPEIDLVDKGISSLDDVPSLCKYTHSLVTINETSFSTLFQSRLSAVV